MKNDKKIFVILELLLACAVIILGFGMTGDRRRNQIDRISVILNDPESTQWAALKYGLKKAADEMGADLSVVGSEDEMSLDRQEKLIRRELDQGTDAILIEPLNTEREAEMLSRVCQKVPLMTIYPLEESEIPVAETTDTAMGGAIANALLADFAGKPGRKTVGIVVSDSASLSAQKRVDGFMARIKSAGLVASWSIAIAEGEVPEEQEKVDFIIALDDRSMAKIGKLSLDRNLHGAVVYGIGQSMEAVYYLDSGAAECLVVPDTFAEGYLSVKSLLSGTPEDVAADHLVIRRKNLYSKEAQDLIFAMSQ